MRDTLRMHDIADLRRVIALATAKPEVPAPVVKALQIKLDALAGRMGAPEVVALAPTKVEVTSLPEPRPWLFTLHRDEDGFLTHVTAHALPRDE